MCTTCPLRMETCYWCLSSSIQYRTRALLCLWLSFEQSSTTGTGPQIAPLYIERFLLNNKHVILAGKENARVFIPLCMKAHELKRFRDLGHSVVGVEFVEECVRSYFKEHDLEMEETTCPIIKCKILQTPDRRPQVFVCNILDFKWECTGPVDIVWDRSGFAAMKKEDRPRYAAKLKSLLAPDFSYGMWSAVYDESLQTEPLAPRSTRGAVIKKRFGDTASKILLIDSRELEMAPFLKAAGGATASLWHLSP